MCTANGKQHLAILGLLVGLVVPTTGQAGDVQRIGPSQGGASAREAAPTPGIEPTQEGAPSPKAAPAQSPRVREPGTGLQRNRAAPTQAGSGFSGGVQAGKNYQFGSTQFCSEGFVKAIMPDHPNGFYACRIPASPPCTVGYEYRLAHTLENRFTYQCAYDHSHSLNNWKGEGKPQVCPQGWNLLQPPTTPGYDCLSSSELTCRSDHEFDGVKIDLLGHDYDYPVVFSYRCKAR